MIGLQRPAELTVDSYIHDTWMTCVSLLTGQ
jgi:hypothetical protein